MTKLDEAWKTVEELLPEGVITLRQREEGSYEAYVQVKRTSMGFGYGSTPVEALEALERRLRVRND